MGRTNYSYEKRLRELEKKRKKEEKRLNKQAKKEADTEADATLPVQPDEADRED